MWQIQPWHDYSDYLQAKSMTPVSVTKGSSHKPCSTYSGSLCNYKKQITIALCNYKISKAIKVCRCSVFFPFKIPYLHAQVPFPLPSGGQNIQWQPCFLMISKISLAFLCNFLILIILYICWHQYISDKMISANLLAGLPHSIQL